MLKFYYLHMDVRIEVLRGEKDIKIDLLNYIWVGNLIVYICNNVIGVDRYQNNCQ